MRRLDLDNKYQSEAVEDLSVLFQFLKQQRYRNGWSQQDVANMTGVSVSSISKFETGRFPTRVVWLAAIARAYGFRLTSDLTFDQPSATLDTDSRETPNE